MNKILIIFAVVILMFVFNKREYFNDSNSKQLKQTKCDNTTKMMSDINMYVDKTCQDTSSTNRYMNNDRLTCRNFVDKQLYIGNDNEGWCDEKNKIPIKRLSGDFSGFNKLDYEGSNPQPSSGDLSESNFPFELDMIKIKDLNLDNKVNE
jgi:hypothetical protein